VLAKAVMLVAMLGVLAEHTPLRTCAVTQQVTGTNCHEHLDHDGPAGERSAAGHGACDGGPTCQCQLPRGDADRATSARMPDLAPPLDAAVWIVDDFTPSDLHTTEVPARPPDNPLAVQLPLLN
jgi:hypothetical protein